MSDNKPKYIEGVGWRYETLHSMHRRMQGHDYRERCIYMITLSTEGRQNLLGSLRWPSGKPSEAIVEPTPLGREVQRCWLSIPGHYPGVVPLALQLMPDHLHGLLFVTREQQAHLGQIVNGFKIGCNKAYRQLIVKYHEALPHDTEREALPHDEREALPAKLPKHPAHGMLFEPGYQDSILMSKGQLDRMFNYIADNPRRLAVKREQPDLFRVVRHLTVRFHEAPPHESADEAQGQTFAAIGNRWLLDRPVRLQVRCHNNTTAANLHLIERQKEYFLRRGKEGAVIVSPCISAGEKEIARAALDAGMPLVVILENGFPPMYKPPGKYFEACAKGLLLMLAPWPYHMERRTITRSQCLALNDMACALSTEPWTQDLEAQLR